MGNDEKLMISYKRERSHDYVMPGACGVLYEGEMHFFGGAYAEDDDKWGRQHFVIETKRTGQIVNMMQKKDLDIGFNDPVCGTFEMTSERFPWFQTSVVLLCFDHNHRQSCYTFDRDSNLRNIGDSNFRHARSGLAKYNDYILTVGGYNQYTEGLKLESDKNSSWSVIDPEFKFIKGKAISGHTLLAIDSSDVYEEYVLLIGGQNQNPDNLRYLRKVFKFNGTWSTFGNFNNARFNHNSIYWNGAVYIFGGQYSWNWYDLNTRSEVWYIKDSPDQFQTVENWPILENWNMPFLFIISDSFFPDFG